MPIKLNWMELNTSVDNYTVYRSVDPIDDANLPAPLATVPAGTLTYTDNTVVRNVVYHYKVTASKSGEVAVSFDKILAYMPDTGPGPQTLKRGDYNYGYFGRVAPNELFDALELSNLVSLNAAAGGVYYGPLQNWGKIIYKGKVLYCPDGWAWGGATWIEIYKAGCMYGNAPVPAMVKTAYGDVKQGVIVTKGKWQLMVRTPVSRLDPLTTSAAAVDQVGGEIDQILQSAFMNRANNVTLPGLDDLKDTYSSATGYFTSDFTNPAVVNNVIMRSFTNTALGNIDGPVVSVATGGASLYSQGWRPILELIL